MNGDACWEESGEKINLLHKLVTYGISWWGKQAQSWSLWKAENQGERYDSSAFPLPPTQSFNKE